MKKFLFPEKIYSRWLILLIDQLIIAWTLFISFLLINKFDYQQLWHSNFFIYMGLYCLIALLVFTGMRIHTGIIRYSNTHDIFRIFMAAWSSSFLFTALCYMFLTPYFAVPAKWFPEILIINFFVSSSLLIMLRIAVKSLFGYLKTMELCDKKENILIYGSGTDSILIKKALEDSKLGNLNVFAFVDDNADKINKHIEQKQVYHSNSIVALKNKFNIKKILFTGDDLNVNGKKKHYR